MDANRGAPTVSLNTTFVEGEPRAKLSKVINASFTMIIFSVSSLPSSSSSFKGSVGMVLIVADSMSVNSLSRMDANKMTYQMYGDVSGRWGGGVSWRAWWPNLEVVR